MVLGRVITILIWYLKLPDMLSLDLLPMFFCSRNATSVCYYGLFEETHCEHVHIGFSAKFAIMNML